jgi:hypothetical protein
MLNAKGEQILAAMKKQYGAERGKAVFYASVNKGTITGVDSGERSSQARDPEALLKAAEDELDALGRQQGEVAARQATIDDRAQVIGRLRDEVLAMRKDTDPVGDVVSLERAQDLVRHIGDAVAELSKRMDAFAQRLN